MSLLEFFLIHLNPLEIGEKGNQYMYRKMCTTVINSFYDLHIFERSRQLMQLLKDISFLDKVVPARKIIILSRYNNC